MACGSIHRELAVVPPAQVGEAPNRAVRRQRSQAALDFPEFPGSSGRLSGTQTADIQAIHDGWKPGAAAVRFQPISNGGEEAVDHYRRPEIVGLAAYAQMFRHARLTGGPKSIPSAVSSALLPGRKGDTGIASPIRRSQPLAELPTTVETQPE